MLVGRLAWLGGGEKKAPVGPACVRSTRVRVQRNGLHNYCGLSTEDVWETHVKLHSVNVLCRREERRRGRGEAKLLASEHSIVRACWGAS